MTPAIDLLNKHGVKFEIHRYTHDPSCESYGDEAVEKLGVTAERVFKTLITESSASDLQVGIIPVNASLNLKAFAKASGVKSLNMADKKRASSVTGYLLGGVSPLGQKVNLPTYIHTSCLEHDSILVSGGKRGIDIELSPQALIELCHARLADIAKSK